MIHHKLKFLNNGERSFINLHLIAANGLKQACRSVSGIEEGLIGNFSEKKIIKNA